jgi:hypothetical protein
MGLPVTETKIFSCKKKKFEAPKHIECIKFSSSFKVGSKILYMRNYSKEIGQF